ncbi:MAG: cytochrome c peroxidase, partial [Pirellulaceae bacterium]|nr:cytochrome c peroxidase [Pirellulaceae bacterium]
VTIQVAYDFQDEPYAIEIDIAHPLRPGEQQEFLAATGRDHVPGAINLGQTGRRKAGSYAANYLQNKLGEKVYGGTYQQSGQKHFGSEPHVDVPLMVAAQAETVVAGARGPADAPVREYNVSAINAQISLNQYHDFFLGYMFVLTEDVEKVRAEENRNADARFNEDDANDPGAVTNGLSGDVAIQPLAIRVNQGERLVINLKNETGGGLDDLDPEKVSFHLHGSSLVVQASGQPATSTNADAYVLPGQTKTFEWYVAPEQQEGVHHFHSHIRDQTSTGMFGSLVVEPRGSRFLDPYTGKEMKSGWLAMIEDPNGPDFREFVVVYHEVGDEAFKPLDKNEEDLLNRDQAADAYRPSARAINYRSESFANNLILQHKMFGIEDESMGYSSYTFGDPSTPIPRSYLGDPAKWRLVHGGSEVFHSHHLHGGAIRWRRQDQLTQDLNLFGTNNFALASGGPIKNPPIRTTSDRVDVQTIGPSETHDLTIECCSGGCQLTAGDFLYHCHIPHHYVAGMWAFWRTYNTLQDGPASTDVMTPLMELPDRKGKMKPAVDSTKLVGKTMKWFGKDFEIVAEGGDPTKGVYSIDEWVESQLPPQGKPGKNDDETMQIAAYDASVWDWAKEKVDGITLYRGEPETAILWPKYRPGVSPTSLKPGERPVLLFDQDTGKRAWPHMKPHFGKRPPFSPDHNPAPFLEPIRRNADGSRSSKVAKPGENGPWSLSPKETAPSQVRQFNVHAIKLPITLSKAEGNGEGHLAPIVDKDGQIYVLHEEEEAIRANDDLKIPLVLRMNVHDTADVILKNEIPDFRDNLFSSKVNMHIHFVQFDTQASDGVITGMSYEQSVRPFTMLEDDEHGFNKPQNEPLTADAAAGATKITLRSSQPFHVGTLIGVGMDQVGKTEIRRITAIEGNDLVLDEPLEHAHKANEIASVEFVRYRWYADSDFGITYWHDHAYGLTSWGHGLFGCTVIEPKGSTYHDPVTGKEVRSGSIVDIRTNEPVSSTVRGSFREYVMQLQDSNPRTENRIVSQTVFEKKKDGQTEPEYINKVGSMDSWSLMDTPFRYLAGGERTSGGSWGLRVEPLNRRLAVNPDPSQLFSSAVHGDPDTPMLRAYLGDPIVLRLLDHAGNEMHTVSVNGHAFPLERYAPNSRLRNSVHLGIAERYDLAIPAAGGVQQQAGDYLYYSGRPSHFGEGLWGIIRVEDERKDDLQPLPGREEIPKSAEKFYPDDAPVKTFNVSAVDMPMDLNPLIDGPSINVEGTNREIITENATGKCFVLDDELKAVEQGKHFHPLTLRVNVGDVIKINLTNRLKKGRASFHADMLAYNPKDSLGINVGNNPGDQTVAAGETRTYTFYAHPDHGETAAMISDWGDVTSHQRDGLYGAIIVGPRGSQYYDPATGDDITLKNAWRADVVIDDSIPENAGRTSYRDAALFFQDEDNVIGTSFMPYVRDAAGLAAVNYRIEPLVWRSEKYEVELEDAYVTTGNDDPVTPIIEALPGDAVKIHVFGAHSEQNTIFALEGHQWPLEPGMDGTEMLESEQLGATEALEVNIVAGGTHKIPGDYVYMSHRLAYAEAGQWGLLRVIGGGDAAGGPRGGDHRIAALDSYKRGKSVAYTGVFDHQEEIVIETSDTTDTGASDKSAKAFSWLTTALMFSLMGGGVVLIRRRHRGIRILGVLLVVGGAFLALSQGHVSAQLRPLDKKDDKKDDTTPGGIRRLGGGGVIGGPGAPAITAAGKTPAAKRKLALDYILNMPKPPAGAKPIDVPGLAPLPPKEAPNAALVELGMMLFFDNRISGDADITCAQCHNPAEGWGTRDELSTGYPGTRYFRNAPTVLNAAHARYLYWDGRLGGDDLATQARDSINDSHFMSSDGRVMLERQKQIPEYLVLYEKSGLGEPSLTKITKAIAAFEQTLVSRNVPLDNYLYGDEAALSDQAKQGLALFTGKAGCVKCHNGPYLTDEKPRNIGVPENPEVFSDPFRIITFRSQLKFVGTPNYMNWRNDPGHFAVTKQYKNFGQFMTPTLREVSRTPPYMHNGMLPTLEAVVDFYNAGGGKTKLNNKDPLIKPLSLSDEEKAALVAFLKSLSGDEINIQLTQKDLPEYGLISEWYTKRN